MASNAPPPVAAAAGMQPPHHPLHYPSTKPGRTTSAPGHSLLGAQAVPPWALVAALAAGSLGVGMRGDGSRGGMDGEAEERSKHGVPDGKGAWWFQVS